MGRFDRLLKAVIVTSLMALLMLGILVQVKSVKVFVGRSKEAAQNTSQDWTVFREGHRMWLSTHGCPDGVHLWFRGNSHGKPMHVKLREVVRFLREEGVDFDGVDEMIIHSCYNGMWKPFELDGIRIRPSQQEHCNTVAISNTGWLYILWRD